MVYLCFPQFQRVNFSEYYLRDANLCSLRHLGPDTPPGRSTDHPGVLYGLTIPILGPSRVVQQMRIRLPVQGTWGQFLVWEATTSEQLSPYATTTEARAPCHNHWSPSALEPALHNKRGPQLENSPCSPPLEKVRAAMKTQRSPNKIH